MKNILRKVMITLFAITFMFCGIGLIGHVSSSKAETTTNYRGAIFSDAYYDNEVLAQVKSAVDDIFSTAITGTYEVKVSQDKAELINMVNQQVASAIDVAWFVMYDEVLLNNFLNQMNDAGVNSQVILLNSDLAAAQNIGNNHSNVSVFYCDSSSLGYNVADLFYPNIENYSQMQIFGQAYRDDVLGFKKYYEDLGYTVSLTDFSSNYNVLSMQNTIQNMLTMGLFNDCAIVCYDENVTDALINCLTAAGMSIGNNCLFFTTNNLLMYQNHYFGYQLNYTNVLKTEFLKIFNGGEIGGIIDLVPTIINF